MKPDVVLLSGFGFKLGCLESLLRSVFDLYTKLDQSVLKETKCFFHEKGKNPVELSRQPVVSHLADNEILKLFFELVLQLPDPFNWLNHGFNRLNECCANSFLKTCFNCLK